MVRSNATIVTPRVFSLCPEVEAFNLRLDMESLTTNVGVILEQVKSEEEKVRYLSREGIRLSIAEPLPLDVGVERQQALEDAFSDCPNEFLLAGVSLTGRKLSFVLYSFSGNYTVDVGVNIPLYSPDFELRLDIPCYANYKTLVLAYRKRFWELNFFDAADLLMQERIYAYGDEPEKQNILVREIRKIYEKI